MRFKWLEKKADFRSSIDNTQNENESHKNRPEDRSSRHIPGKRKIIKEKPDQMDFQTKRLEKPKTNRALDKRSAFKTVPRNKFKKEKELLHNPCC
jgi:hypothetical protein